MLEYQSLPLTDFGGGITDNYKSVGSSKFKELENITILENKSASIRNGVGVQAKTLSTGISAISAIGDTIITVAGNSVEYLDEDEFRSTDNAASSMLPTYNQDDHIAMMQQWRNSVLINTTSDDHIIRTSEYFDGSVKTQRASLPKVTDLTVTIPTTPSSTSTRLYAVTIEREYIDKDSFRFTEYAPEYIDSVIVDDGDDIEITAIDPDVSSGYDLYTDEITYSLWMTLENGTILYRVATSDTNEIAYTVDDDTLEDGAIGFFLSEEQKIAIPICKYFSVINNTGWYANVTTVVDGTSSIGEWGGDAIDEWVVDETYELEDRYSYDGVAYERTEYTGVDDTEWDEDQWELAFQQDDVWEYQSEYYRCMVENGEIEFNSDNWISSTSRPYRIYQSVQGMPTSVLASGLHDVDYPIVGIGSINSLPIVLTTRAAYRLDGTIGVDGTGDINSSRIQGSEGGIAHNSMILANDKLYYCGTDGVYVTDGYKATNITGADLYKRYSNLISDDAGWKNISGTFDRDNDIIYWSISGTVLALHLRSNGFTTHIYDSLGSIKCMYADRFYSSKYMCDTGVEIDRADDAYGYTKINVAVTDVAIIRAGMDISLVSGTPITRISGEVFSVTDEYVSEGYNGYITFRYTTGSEPDENYFDGQSVYSVYDDIVSKVLIGTEFKHLLLSTEGLYRDTVPDDTDLPWSTVPIEFDILTSGINYGSSAAKKWVRDVTASVRTSARLAIEPYVIVEDNADDTAMKLISNVSGHNPFDVNDINIRDTRRWLTKSVYNAKRHLPKGKCRCRMNQIGLRTTVTGLYRSLDYSTATVESVDDVSITVRMDTIDDTIVRFPYWLSDNSIVVKTSDSEFSRKARIISVGDDRQTIEITMVNDVAIEVGDTLDWIIYAIPSGAIELMALTISYAMLSNGGSGYQTSDDARNSYE